MSFSTWHGVATVLGLLIFLFGARTVLMATGTAVAAIGAAIYALSRIVRWLLARFKTRQTA